MENAKFKINFAFLILNFAFVMPRLRRAENRARHSPNQLPPACLLRLHQTPVCLNAPHGSCSGRAAGQDDVRWPSAQFLRDRGRMRISLLTRCSLAERSCLASLKRQLKVSQYRTGTRGPYREVNRTTISVSIATGRFSTTYGRYRHCKTASRADAARTGAPSSTVADFTLPSTPISSLSRTAPLRPDRRAISGYCGSRRLMMRSLRAALETFSGPELPG